MSISEQQFPANHSFYGFCNRLRNSISEQQFPVSAFRNLVGSPHRLLPDFLQGGRLECLLRVDSFPDERRRQQNRLHAVGRKIKRRQFPIAQTVEKKPDALAGLQGIGYRQWAVRTALQVGEVSGWVRNAATGDVEILMRGPEEKVDEMLRLCHRGPLLARVDKVAFIGGRLSGFLPLVEDGVFRRV